MSWQLLSLVSAAYLWVGVTYFLEGRKGMALAFVAYALANGGFILDAWEAGRKVVS